jgi:hypothetical protein
MGTGIGIWCEMKSHADSIFESTIQSNTKINKHNQAVNSSSYHPDYSN